ncbi:MAG: hypothetical protein R3D00_14775 [Bacteroidia bacterium]
MKNHTIIILVSCFIMLLAGCQGCCIDKPVCSPTEKLLLDVCECQCNIKENGYPCAVGSIAHPDPLVCYCECPPGYSGDLCDIYSGSSHSICGQVLEGNYTVSDSFNFQKVTYPVTFKNVLPINPINDNFTYSFQIANFGNSGNEATLVASEDGYMCNMRFPNGTSLNISNYGNLTELYGFAHNTSVGFHNPPHFEMQLNVGGTPHLLWFTRN